MGNFKCKIFSMSEFGYANVTKYLNQNSGPVAHMGLFVLSKLTMYGTF